VTTELRLAWQTKSMTDDKPKGIIHASKWMGIGYAEGKKTLCGKRLTYKGNWFLWITGNGEVVNCKKCLKLMKEVKNG